MSTRSTIAIQRKDGTRTGIYCHFDGYIEGVGLILQLAYNTADKVEKLLSLGNLSVLGYYTEPDEKIPHNFEMRQPNVCVAYHRDRGDDFQQWDGEQEFNYRFDEYDGVWYVSYHVWKNTVGGEILCMNSHCTKEEKLLLDAIWDVDFSALNWIDDEFATSDNIWDECIKKALEGREEAMKNNG